MMDDYCLKCHKDAYDGWFHSAHHISSFNNKAYLTSVRETRKVALERDGSTQAARWCAGCHDPVPFFSGEFDDPNYDDVQQPDQPGGHHLHDLPRDHQRQQHPGQRRLHDRGAPALSLRLQRRPALAVDQQRAGEGQARDAQEDVPEAGHQGRRSSARPATRSASRTASTTTKTSSAGRTTTTRSCSRASRATERRASIIPRWPRRTASSATWS